MTDTAPHAPAREPACDGEGSDERWALYRSMLRIRLVEEEIAHRYAEQEMRCPTHLCIGQEAPPVGVSAGLRDGDLVFSAHRSHGHYLARGGDLKGMLAELYGRATGCADGKGGSQHLIDLSVGFMGSAPILASTISVGVGAAWAARQRKQDQVIVIYFGDAATEEGVFHESLNFAGLCRLPVVFVCENNLYSVHAGLDVRQPSRPISALAPPHAVAGETLDGNDVEAVRAASRRAIDLARDGGGPTLLEMHTYRWMEHVGPKEDGHLGYRSPDEIEAWRRECPILRYERRLKDLGLWTDASADQTRADIGAEIDEAFAFAKSSPYPELSALWQHVYPETAP